MRPVGIIAQAVVRDAIRRKVVWVVIVFAALMSFTAPVLPSHGVGVAGSVFREVAISLMYAAALVVTLVLACTRIPNEIERRTVYNLLARDIRRRDYVLGTWIGLLAVIGASLLAFTVVSVVVGAVAYREFMWTLFAATYAVWLEMGVICAFALLMTTLFAPATSVVGTLTFIFVGHAVAGLLPSEVTSFVPTLEVFNVIAPVAHGSGYGLAYAAGMTGVFAASSLLLVLAASATFQSRDL